MESAHIAVDLGAGSGRVFVGRFPADGRFLIDEVHRFRYPPRESDGHLRWDFRAIISEIKRGLALAANRARELEVSPATIGVDSWAVDYGLLGSDGNLIADPVCYRDARTEGIPDRVFGIVPKSEIFERTGIQFLNFNTIYQLFADDRFAGAASFLLLPDLINYVLTGRRAAEYTNATTTQLVDARTGDWDADLIIRLGFDIEKFPPIVPPGSELGFLLDGIAAETGLGPIRVIAPATHDTGSAVAGTPLGRSDAYISSGTWSLVGIERESPLIDERVAGENFTNEGGAHGTIRFLKNVMGLWIFESCRREWKDQGINTDYARLLDEVAAVDGYRGVIFPDDPRFLNPPSMLGAIAAQLAETGQQMPDSAAGVAKLIFDSLAFRYASIISTIESLARNAVGSVQIVGGGGRNDYLNQATANASEKKVAAGLIEATVTGNLAVQAIAAGRFADLAKARACVAKSLDLKEFSPLIVPGLHAAKLKYAAIEKRFLG